MVRDGARSKLAREAKAATVHQLMALLDAPQRTTRRRVARILSEIEPALANPILDQTLNDPLRSERVRASAARVLSVLADGPRMALATGLQSDSARIRRACATAAAPVEALIKALADDAPEVVERAAVALTALDHVPPASALEVAARHGSPAVLRLLSRAAPAAPALVEQALGGEPAALDHLEDRGALLSLVEGPLRTSAAWALSRLGATPEALATDPDPRLRAAFARMLRPEDPRLARLCEDPDVGVAWIAKRAQAGAFSAEAAHARTERHARMDGPSARPPYGLRPGDEVPTVERAHAALALCHTRFDVNLGVAVRSAEAAGLREVFLVGRGDLFRSPARGTDTLLPIRHACDAAELIRFAREGDYQIVAVQQTPTSVSYATAPYPPRPLFVLGTEDDGLPPALRAGADLAVEIPMHGVIDSLNVAAAATCVMFGWRATLR